MKLLIKKVLNFFISFFKNEYRAKSGIKYGYDANGMPYIDQGFVFRKPHCLRWG
jgi:hypothetical protein